MTATRARVIPVATAAARTPPWIVMTVTVVQAITAPMGRAIMMGVTITIRAPTTRVRGKPVIMTRLTVMIQILVQMITVRAARATTRG